MKILAIDTTSTAASVAVINEEKLIGEYTCDASLSHLEKLMPMIENMLSNCELTIKDIDCLAVSDGPGSFTGIRIGVSTARALAQTLKKPIISVSTLKAMAYNVSSYSGVICPIIDARRNQVYAAAYKWKNGECVELLEPKAYLIGNVLDMMKEHKEVMFLGDGVKVQKEKITDELGVSAKFAPQNVLMQKASSVAQLGFELANSTSEQKEYYEIHPNYLRKTEAERNLEQKKKEAAEKKDE